MNLKKHIYWANMYTTRGARIHIQKNILLHDSKLSALLHPITVPTAPQTVTITRMLQDGVELNWLPPTEPNGEVHYVIYYTPKGGTEQSIDTGSDLTHYNLTGLERNRVYTNIAVQAVNIIGRSERSTVIAQYNHTLPGEQIF